MREFDLNLLRLAVAIELEGSVSGAARRLGISQPAASSALNRLRQAVHDPLFVKTARGMEPTPRAADLVRTAREVLGRIDNEILSGTAFDPATTSATFTFALSDIGELVFLPKLVEYFGEHAPNAAIRSVSRSPSLLEKGLEDGDIDLAVGYYPDLRRNCFLQQRLMTHHFVCLLRAGHPIRSKHLSLEEFLGLRHAVVNAEGRSQEILEHFLEQKGIIRKIALRTPHFMSIPMIIAESDLVVTVPHALGLYFGAGTVAAAEVRIAEPPLDIPRIVLRQHWHRRFDRDPKVRWLREVVSALFNDSVDEWRA